MRTLFLMFKKPSDEIIYRTTRFMGLFEGQTHLFWTTFGLGCPAQDLLQSKATPFIAFGTADEQVDANRMETIVAELIAAKRNFAVRRVIGGSHVLDTPGSPPFSNLVKIFTEVVTWIDESSPSF